MKKITDAMAADKELQKLIAQYREMFGRHRPYSIWTDGGIEGYREKLRKSIKEKNHIDEYNGVLKKWLCKAKKIIF